MPKYCSPLNTRFALFAITAAVATTVSGATVNWTNPGSGNWSDGANWSNGVPPSSATSDVANIDNGGTAIIDSTQNVTTGSLTLANTTGSTGNVQITGGSLTTTTTDIRVGGNGGASGGTGIFTQSGGSVRLNAGNLNIGFGGTSSGTYNLSGGSVHVDSAFIMAIGNIGTGTMNQSGGTVYIRSATTPANSVIQLGRNSGTAAASGTYTLSGGIAAARNFQFGRQVQASNTATTSSNNTFNLQGTGMLITNGISVLNTTSNATNTFNFTGGTLIANSIGLSLTNNGGTLRPDFADFTGVPANIDSIPIVPFSTLTFTGSSSYTQTAAGTLKIDLGSSLSDFIDIGSGANVGNASISGVISISLESGYNPAIGTTFDILAADNLNQNAIVAGLTPSGYGFSASEAIGGDGREVLRLTVVPEPSSGLMLVCAGVAFAFRRKRR